jgi:tRNA nucleotidyltransferase (CCA-adding enzyme)
VHIVTQVRSSADDARGERVGRWDHFDHGADIGIRGVGPTKEAAFAQAARAMTAVVADLAAVQASEPVELNCEAPDDVLLLVDFLNELVYEMAARSMLFSRFELDIDDGRLTGRAWGEPVDRGRHRPAVEVKGATLTAGEVAFRDGQWIAQCVVDV